MATQDEQMNMLMQQGGMQDDGMTRDPVSGNEVPPGSLAKEVRDDIPAQLSEGEYVIPADAVQFHGLKFYEATVQEAKMGLADMNARGRIGGEPVPQEQTPQALPFDISELQTRESAPQQPMPMMNRGCVIYANEGVFTGVSGQTTKPKLDFSNTDAYFSNPNRGSTNQASLARFIAPGCKQKEVLVSGNRVPITAGSTEVDGVNYVDITSDAGLNIVKGCSEISLNPSEEKLVIDRIGQAEYDKYKGGETRPTETETKVEGEPEPQPDDDDGRRQPQEDDFIKGWNMDKMTDYFGDMTKFYDGTEDTLIGGILKGITKPIVKLNHKHIVGRAMELLEGRKDPKTGEDLSEAQIATLTGILKMNPGGMIQDAFNIGGRTIAWNPETGTYESNTFDPTLIGGDNNLGGGGGNQPPGLGEVPKTGVTQDMYDKAGVYQGDYKTSGISSIPKSGSADMANRSIMYKDDDGIKGLITSVDTQKAASKPARSEEDIKQAKDFEKDEPGYEKRQSSTVYRGDVEATTKATKASARDNKPQTEEEKEQERLSSAYSSSDSMASGKFMNKGGLAKKRKRTTKKK